MIKYNSDWATFTLKDVCTRITDGSHYSPKSVENGLPMASVKDLTPFGINLESCRLISKDDFSALAYQDCKPIVGDVLISKDGASALDTVCEVKQEVDVVLLSSVAILRPDINKIIPAYLRYYLDAESTRKYLKDVFITGAAIPRIVLKDFKRAEIRLPPLPEQRAIARILGSLDDKIELNRRMNETLESIARAIFKSWFVDFDPVRAKSEGREPVGMNAETAALFPDSFEETELGMVPQGWKIAAIGDVVKIVGGSTPSTEDPQFWNGTINFATPKDLASLTSPILLNTERRITEKGLVHISSGLLPKGTVLLSSRAPIGYLALTEIPVAINQGFIALICRGDLPNYFAINWISQNMETIIGNANGTTFLEISKQNFRPIQLVIPSDSILKEFTSKVEALYGQLICNQKQNNILAAIRDSLLPNLISGALKFEAIK